jgi:hypothetical protein
MSTSNNTHEATLGSQHEIYLDETSAKKAPELIIPSETNETSTEQAPELIIPSETNETSTEQAPELIIPSETNETSTEQVELKMLITNTSKTVVQALESQTPIRSACTISHKPIISKIDIAPKTIKLVQDKSPSYLPTILATLAGGFSLGLLAFIEFHKKESNADKTHKNDEETADDDIRQEAIKRFKELTTKDTKDDGDRDDGHPTIFMSLGSQSAAMAARSTPQVETRELIAEVPTEEMTITTNPDTLTFTILWNGHTITIDYDDFIAQIVENTAMVEALQTLGSDTLTLFTNGDIQIMHIDDESEKHAASASAESAGSTTTLGAAGAEGGSEGDGEPAAASAESASSTTTLGATGAEGGSEGDREPAAASAEGGSEGDGEPAAASAESAGSTTTLGATGAEGITTPSRSTGGAEPSTVAKDNDEASSIDGSGCAADAGDMGKLPDDDRDVSGKVAPTGCWCW